MSWDAEKSEARIWEHLESIPPIEVQPLERKANLETLLSETCCREIEGAHIYVDVPNFSQLIGGAENEDQLRQIIRAIHIYQRQLSRITEETFDGVRVHFQGVRMHALLYRPIGELTELATRAFLLSVLARDFLRHIFNPRFESMPNLALSTGTDIGTVIGTRNGMRGDRELLFLGTTANQAAKILETGLRLTPNMFVQLPERLQQLCESDGDFYRVMPLTKDEVDDLVATADISWDRDELSELVEADLEAFPIADIKISGATELIDLDSLSIFNNKGVRAASLFADLCGFTAFIERAETDEQKQDALKALHLARKEFTRVATQDFNGLRVQFQGDRMQALFHLPEADGALAKKSTAVAIAIQSSMEILRSAFEPMASLQVAVGVDLGDVVISNLGTRGHRDRIVIGTSVVQAARNEERCDKREIGVSGIVYRELEDDLRNQFAYSNEKRCYIARGLTFAALDRKAAGEVYRGASPVIIQRTGSGLAVTGVGSGNKVTPAASYSE